MRSIYKNILVKLLHVAPVASLALLLGCAGSMVNRHSVITPETQFKPNQGLVVARVINVSSYPLPFNTLTITPENLNASKKVKPDELNSLTPYTKGTTVFASNINAGNYALKDITAWHIRGDYRYSKYVFTDAKLGTFEVKPGHVTDLGTILYYPKPQTDKYLDVLTRIPNTANGDLVKRYFPFYPMQADKLLTWKEDGGEEDRESLFASIAQNPVDFGNRYLAPDGSLYLLSKLGVILKRTPQGEWELDAVETNLNLNAIAQNQNGDLIVGGLEGRLFWKPANQEWIDISLDHRNTIKSLSFSDENTIDMLVAKGYEALVLRAPVSQSALNWQQLNQYTYTKGWQNLAEVKQEESRPKTKKSARDKMKNKKSPQDISYLEIKEIDGQHLIDVGSRSSRDNGAFPETDYKTYAYDPISWEISTPKQKEDAPELSAEVEAGTVKLGIEKLGFWDWDGRPSYFRQDPATNQWHEINTHVNRCPGGDISNKKLCNKEGKKVKSRKTSFYLASVPHFTSELEAITIAKFTDMDFWSGKRTNETKILKTTDGGLTWSDTGNTLPFKFCSALIGQIKDRLLLSCDGVSSDFYESFDEGASWNHVKQHENF